MPAALDITPYKDYALVLDRSMDISDWLPGIIGRRVSLPPDSVLFYPFWAIVMYSDNLLYLPFRFSVDYFWQWF
jgi:hypothetical protein